MRLKLDKHDRIVTVYAESAAGPGWANTPVWVIIRSNLDGTLRQACLQPGECSADMLRLYRYSELAHRDMKEAAEHLLLVKAK